MDHQKILKKRWKRHIGELNKNKHINNLLQRAWIKYGENSFMFEFLEECSNEILHEVEQNYLDKYQPFTPNGYNIGKSSSGGDNLSMNPNREKIIEKMSITNKNLWDSKTEEEKKHISEKMKGSNNPNWRNGSSKKYCVCGKQINYGIKVCKNCHDKSGINNSFYGKKHSESTKEKISKIKKNKYYGTQNKPIIIDGFEYTSLGEASKCLKICIATIRWRVLSKNPSYINYQYKGEQKICLTKGEKKERLSKPQIGKKHNHNKPFFIDEIEYRTLKEASEILGVHQITIRGRLLSKNDEFNNYRYK